MCIRDRIEIGRVRFQQGEYPSARRELETSLELARGLSDTCLLYTSDAADERSSVDLGGRRIIKKKNNTNIVIDDRT